MQESLNRFPPGVAVGDVEVTLGEVFRQIWRRRAIVAAVTGLGVLASVGIAFSQPSLYQAAVTLMPIDSQSQQLSIEAPAGPLGGLFSPTVMSRDGTISDKLIALLRSKSVAEQVLTRHRLLSAIAPKAGVSDPTSFDLALRALAKVTQVESDPKAGLIMVKVEHRDPRVAAELANAYAAELDAFLQANTLSSVRRQRTFLEQKVQTVADELDSAETALVDYQEDNWLIALDIQTQAIVQSYEALKSQLRSKELEVTLQSRSVSQDDLQLLGLRQEVGQLKAAMKSVEDGTSGELFAMKDVPKLQLGLSKRQREVSTKQKLHELLTQKLELTKIEEAKDPLAFQIIDKATPPAETSTPNRQVILLIGAFFSLVIGMVSALMIERWFSPRTAAGALEVPLGP